jgi:guanosine-3',5'-bis(diphosphate) 3'-pyrophosphohydrolase
MNHNEILIKASVFASEKHKFQRRKGCLKIPYINHPLRVCEILIDVNENNIDLLIAAILHDTLEDTDTSDQEILDLFGEKALSIVKEVTDDMSLPSKKRKELQIEKAGKLSIEAKLIKIADKASNISDLVRYPIQWDRDRKIEYVNWSLKVYDKCKGLNKQLDSMFENICQQALDHFKK